MPEAPKFCPLTDKFCKGHLCIWWSKWTDDYGTTFENCVIFQIVDRIYDIGDAVAELKKDK